MHLMHLESLMSIVIQTRVSPAPEQAISDGGGTSFEGQILPEFWSELLDSKLYWIKK